VKYIALLLLLLAIAGCGRFKSTESVIALEGVTLIDGSGGAPKEDAVIIIRNGHIESVARVNEIVIPKNAVRMNLAGKTVIPGLIDSHAHVERWAAQRYIAWGVTTVRDLHGDMDSILALRNDMNLGSILGPRMFTAGAMIDGIPRPIPMRPVSRAPSRPGAPSTSTSSRASITSRCTPRSRRHCCAR